MCEVRSTFSFAVMTFCVLKLFLNAVVTDLNCIYLLWSTEFAPPKPTYSVNVASSLKFEVRAENVAKNTFSLQMTTLLTDFLSNSLRKYMNRMGILMKMMI